MLDSREWGQSTMGICALCYIHIYLKCMWCNGFPEIYAQLEEAGWGQFAMGICALCHICQVWCNSMQGIYAQLTGGQSIIDPCYTITPPANQL